MEHYFITLKSRFNAEIQYFPKPVRLFLFRVLLLSVIWKCLYGFLLYEPKTLDRPLTDAVGKHSAWILNQLYESNQFCSKLLTTESLFEGELRVGKASHIYFADSLVMFIADPCNGLELFILYLIFILAMPSSLKRKVIFIIVGLIIIHLVNLLRCVGLVVLLLHFDKYFNIAHHYIFKVMVYITIFFLWVQFSKKTTFKLIKNEV